MSATEQQLKNLQNYRTEYERFNTNKKEFDELLKFYQVIFTKILGSFNVEQLADVNNLFDNLKDVRNKLGKNRLLEKRVKKELEK